MHNEKYMTLKDVVKFIYFLIIYQKFVGRYLYSALFSFIFTAGDQIETAYWIKKTYC